jgi:Tfp pilus assembly protein PilF
VIEVVDYARNLGRARITLELLRRAGPPDPAVLVQLARVTLMQASDLTDSDVPPSVPRLDQGSLQTAQRWLDAALALNTHRTETLMMLGYVAYLKGDFKQSLALLEQARAIGPDSAWLLVDLGNTLWAIGSHSDARNDTQIKQAVDDFQAALGMHPPDGARFTALHQLSAAYAALGDIEKASSFHRQLISMTQGTNRAYLLHRYAIFLLFAAHDVDSALSAMREAVRLDNFELGRAFLVNVLTVKAGMLYTAGRAHEAAPYIAEARQMQPDLESTCPTLARLPGSFPGVFANHAAGLLKNFCGSIGGQTLVLASRYATRDEIKQLLSWGANPNYFDSEEGAPLHAAILGENTAAITVLLAAGANPLAPYVDGRTPAQILESASTANMAQIRTLVVNAAQARTAKTGSVGTPLRAGYRYRMKTPISGDRWGNDFATAEEFIFIDNNCQWSDLTFACFSVKPMTEPGQIRLMALPKEQLSSWADWFEELGPEKSSGPH